MYLLGDIGNTEINFFLFDKNFKVKKKLNLPTSNLTLNYLNRKSNIFLSEKSKISKILFSSVVQNLLKLLKIF